MKKNLPSMSLTELNGQQRLFLTALLELGGGPQNASAAAMTAGYADNGPDAERAARILLGSPKIIKALKNAINHRFDVAASAACETLVEICTNKKAPARARISAAEKILDRAPSFGPIASRSMSISANVGIEDLLDRLDAQEREAKAPAIDVEAVDITPRDDDEAEMD